MYCAKISPEFERQVQRSKVKVTRDRKGRLSAADTPGCVRMVCARCKQRAAADGSIFAAVSWCFRVSSVSSTPVGKSAQFFKRLIFLNDDHKIRR